jgi:hypothetical protein
MKPSPVFVTCDGPHPNEVEQFLGAGDDFDPVTVELPDELRPQVLYPAVMEHWIARNLIGLEFIMRSIRPGRVGGRHQPFSPRHSRAAAGRSGRG